MDAFTHAVLGATVSCVTHSDRARTGIRERALLGAAAAVFPDVDFVGFLFDPLVFLADWHQGPTHSVVLLPVWSLLIGGVFVTLTRRRHAFSEAVGISALGLTSHIAADSITAYGTAVLYPLSDARVGLGTTFVIDPLFTALAAAGLYIGLHMRRRMGAGLSLAVLGLYVGGQALLQQHASEIGRATLRGQGHTMERMVALAQPFSPFNWKLIGVSGPTYLVAHLNVATHPPLIPSLPGIERWAALAAAYQPPNELQWRRRHRYGDQPEYRPLARQLWQRPGFAPYRRFAVFPAVSRIDIEDKETCVWFTDLRYDLPALPDTFRYGFCRAGRRAPWRLYRLRYFSENERQALRE